MLAWIQAGRAWNDGIGESPGTWKKSNAIKVANDPSILDHPDSAHALHFAVLAAAGSVPMPAV